MTLIDPYGRKITYLRISITDHCNTARCYSMHVPAGRSHLKSSDHLSSEELLRLCKVAVEAGITQIRITGGEPLLREDAVDLCRKIGKIQGLSTLALTTDGVRLADMAAGLRKAGVHRINVSLDTLRSDRYAEITGQDALAQVLAGIRAAERVGFAPIKINVVVMRGVNDDEIGRLAEMSYERPYHVRFTELMPFHNPKAGAYQDLFMPIGEIIQRIPYIDRATVGPALNTGGPARLCRLPMARGRVGFIAPVSWYFCGSCNRLRLTADGKIRPCLFSDQEMDIKGLIRKGASKLELIDMFRQASMAKPRRHQLGSDGQPHRQRQRLYAKEIQRAPEHIAAASTTATMSINGRSGGRMSGCEVS
ncbi:MAG: GTP 3',8-cyclase MoaA [Desulfobacteraceae bacterium]|nr:GTP 3',8-cyclase MoaA [Desulfobacteraceae bacterium]